MRNLCSTWLVLLHLVVAVGLKCETCSLSSILPVVGLLRTDSSVLWTCLCSLGLRPVEVETVGFTNLRDRYIGTRPGHLLPS